MRYSEEPLAFPCAGETLVGVVTRPEHALRTGVLVVVGGPQYRAGSHRQFVQLARAAAAAGFPVFRFDVRGMGDSSGALRSFDDIDEDISAAVQAFAQQCPDLQRLVLWGLCDGASAALLWLQLARSPLPVAGLCLCNPWVRSVQSLARIHVRHYYLARLGERAFWIKLLRGGVAGKALGEFWGNLKATLSGTPRSRGGSTEPFQDRMARQWLAFPGHILLVISADDHTAREFIDVAGSRPAWQGALTRAAVERLDLPLADHTFSRSQDRLAMEQGFLAWLRGFASVAAAPQPISEKVHVDRAHT